MTEQRDLPTSGDAQAAADWGFFGRLRNGLSKTREQLAQGLGNLLLGEKEINESALEDLEAALLMTDVGMETTQAIIAELTDRAGRRELANMGALYQALQELLVQRLDGVAQPLVVEPRAANGLPKVFIFVGVNGVGKTTSIGKLAKFFSSQGLSVLIGAADTFRAAAIEQLEMWAERADVEIVKQNMGSDPASVAYDTLNSALNKNYDVVIIDTAGRLHNKINLMTELSKIGRVMNKLVHNAPHEIILVLDGSTGQNAFEQAKQFSEATKVTSLMVTKLDGTAKGGVVIGISDQLSVPVKYIGTGEKIDDIELFDKKDFVESFFNKN